MDIISSLFTLLTDTSVLLGLYIVVRYVIIDRSNGLPPGPRFRIPIIGHLYDVDRDMRKFLRRNRRKYGDIYSLYFGSQLIIVIAGYDKLKEAFVKNGEIFSDRPKSKNVYTEMTKGKGVVIATGKLWEEHRKFCLTTLRNLGMGKDVLEETIHSEVQSLLKIFSSKSQQSFDPSDVVYVAISNAMNALSFGGHFRHDDPRYKEMVRKVIDIFSTFGISAIGSFMPALAYLPGDIFKIKQTLKKAEEVYDFLCEFATEHLQEFDENSVKDFTSAFIKEMKTQQQNKETTTFTMEQLGHILRDFFFVGTETTSTILRWALVYLVNFPDIQEQLFTSIQEEIGTDRLPRMSDRSKVPMIDAFMQECLRHADLNITSIVRATSRDVMFHGYLIPTTATILADLDSVKQDKELWKDPEVFRPQRFIDASGSLTTPEYFVSFFMGRRNCLGESLARMEMFLFLSAIVQNFKISAPPGEDLSLGTLDTFGMTHMPKHYNIIATPRYIEAQPVFL